MDHFWYVDEWKIVFLILIQSNNLFFFNFPKFECMNESFSWMIPQSTFYQSRRHSYSIVLRDQRIEKLFLWISMNKHQMWINLITNNFQPVRRIDYNLYENKSSSHTFFLGQNNTVCHYRNNCYYKIQFLIMVLHGSFRRIGVIFNRLNRSCTLDIRIINNQLRDFRRYTFANIR